MIAMPKFAMTEFTQMVLQHYGLKKENVQLWINGHYIIRRMYTTDYQPIFNLPIPSKCIASYSRLNDILEKQQNPNQNDLHNIYWQTKNPSQISSSDFQIVQIENKDLQHIHSVLSGVNMLLTEFGQHLLYLLFCEPPKLLVIALSQEEPTLDYYISLMDKVYKTPIQYMQLFI
jgi:Cft2 family RNA processing exonuclease